MPAAEQQLQEQIHLLSSMAGIDPAELKTLHCDPESTLIHLKLLCLKKTDPFRWKGLQKCLLCQLYWASVSLP